MRVTVVQLCRSRPVTPLMGHGSPHYTARLARRCLQFGSFATQKRYLSNTEMTQKQLDDVKIDRDRLWKDLHHTCEWGKGERWGE